MHEIAHQPSRTIIRIELPTPGLPEIANRTKLWLQLLAVKKPPSHGFHAGLGVLLVVILDEQMPQQMIPEVFANHKVFDFAEFVGLRENVLEELLKVFVVFFRGLANTAVRGQRVVPHVWDQHAGGKQRFVVTALTTIHVAAAADFEVEWAVLTVFLRAVDASQVAGPAVH